jgi:hypothetical protein
MTTLTTEPDTEPVLQVRELYLEDIPVLPVAEMPDELFADGPDAFADLMTKALADGTDGLGPDAFAGTHVPLEAIVDFVMRLMPFTSGSPPMLFMIIGDAGPREGGCICGYSDSECAQRRTRTLARLNGTTGYPIEL